MGEGLGEVADQPAADGVVLLGEQAEIVAQRQQPPEQLLGVLGPPDHVQAVDQPERTGEEGALAAGQPVDGAVVGGAIAQDEPVVEQRLLDRLDRADHPGVLGRQESHQRDHQDTGVELVAVVVLGERSRSPGCSPSRTPR